MTYSHIQQQTKRNVALLVIFFTMYFIAPSVKAINKLIVLVPNFPPYTYEDNLKISGVGIELANKVFRQAKVQVEYHLQPNYAKALYELEQGRGDALLLASQNSERDSVAVFTKPLMINRWCWYLPRKSKLSPHDKNFIKSAKVSSHFKTNTHKWLTSKNYIVEPAMQLTKLPEMLLKQRIDAVFLAELVFEEAVKQDKLQLEQFKKYIEVEKPFGIYLSKRYLKEHPNTLPKINNAIDASI